MLTLLKDLKCFAPQYLGLKDILLCGNKIYKITKPGEFSDNLLISRQIPCQGLTAFPGIVDQHVHIIGGGGEGGFTSRIPELKFDQIILAGVTTLVGVLGVDSHTRSLENLLAKANALEEQGITAFIYTGSYAVPTVTLTGNIARDLVLIDKIIGTGEIAISDHRSSLPTLDELIKLSSDTHIGGLLSGKAGIVHIHIGDGKAGLEPLLELRNKSELPAEQFVPTHVNRNGSLFEQAMEYCKNGGNIDLTAGETAGITVPDAIRRLKDSGLDMSKVTVSSDANGSIPNGGISSISTLFEDIKNSISQKGIPTEIAFGLVTENVAKILKLFPKKGTLKEGSDADIMITDSSFQIQKIISQGKLLVDNGKVLS